MAAITLNLLAIKISIVLEININSRSSTDRGEGTQWRNSKEKERLEKMVRR